MKTAKSLYGGSEMIEQDDATIIDHSLVLLPKLARDKGTTLKQKHGYKASKLSTTRAPWVRYLL